MDMDFYNEHILTDLDRADYVGGIDNEAIFFEDLQVTAGLGRLGPDGSNNNNTTNNGGENPTLPCTAKTETPVTSPSPMTTIGPPDIILPSIPTVSARVSLTSAPTTPHIGIHHSNNNNNPTLSHLPESPPDSGSEPPYSPLQDVQGLTLNTRDIYNHGAGGGNSTPAINDLHNMQVHHPPQPPPIPQQHHYTHLLNSPMNVNPLASPPNQEALNAGVRVKHETGLIINPNNLTQTLNSQTLHSNVSHSLDTHIEMPSQQQQQQQTQLMYAATNNNHNHHNSSPNNQINYESLTNKLYANPGQPAPPPPYQINLNHLEHPSVVETSTCMLSSIGDLPHVQVVGTSIPSTPTLSRTSAPSTPNHQSSSRKRKMTTQIDDPDFRCVKPDPGLILSPSRSSVCSTPLPGDSSKRSSISPLNIQLSNHDMIDTPAPSNASLSPALSSVHMDGSVKNCDTTSQSGDALSPCIRFSPFQQQNWHKLCDQHLQEISVVYYRVDADKGFNFSVSDDAFVCQKKNHFQITCHARLQSEAKFVRTPSGLEKIKSFHLHFYGVKLEAPNQTIRIEQSQSDRSKKPFFPVPIDLQSHIVSKVTVGRLHFSETTNNNMRKKGRPNPEQRYFQLIVALHVHTASGDFPIISQGSDKIIVRASNPGQFESDVDLCWQRGLTQDSIYHAGRVGINTDRPDESLVVHGNLKISGHIVQPSDSRAKQEIGELDTSVQLRNLQKIRIVRYRLEPQFALHAGLKGHKDTGEIVDTGVIAQEVREVIPDAVQEAGSVVLPNGNVIENFLLVNKDRILMENIGAVKELCKVTGTLETRIENLERVNTRLQRAKENELQFLHCKSITSNRDGYEICSNRTLQIIIFLLVIVMAACLAAVSTLYFVEHNKKQQSLKYLDSIQLLNNGHLYGHEGLTLTEQEHNFINMLKSARNHTHWPSFAYQSPIAVGGGALGAGVTRSQSRNQTEYQRADYRYLGTPENLSNPSSAQQLRNDEITVVMEKPSVSHELLQVYNEPQRATAAPTLARNNKTSISKHKNKWPQPQIVLRVMQSATHRNALPSTRSLNLNGQANEETPQNVSHNASETSTEKIADVQQDFENNSIDTDSHQQQQVNNRVKLAPAKIRTPAAKVPTHSEIQKLNVDLPIVSTSSSNIIDETGLVIENSATQSNLLRHTNPKGGEPIIYKTVSPPTATTSTTSSRSITNKVNTDAPHTNNSLENQSITNKSRNFVDRTTDNSDLLQQLSNDNNESIYSATDIIGNPENFILGLDDRQSLLGRRSSSPSSAGSTGHQQEIANVWVQNSIAYVNTFGEPEQCNSKTKREDISNCQSVCFEENNQLLAPNQSNLNLRPSEAKKIKPSLQQEEIDNENHSESEDNDAIINDTDDDLQSTYNGNVKNKETLDGSTLAASLPQGRTTHNKQTPLKQLATEGERPDDAENLDVLLEHTFSDETVDEETKKIKKDKIEVGIVQPKLSVDPDLPPDETDCWKIRSCIWAERLNNTFATDDFCPKLGKSVNKTFVIPLSRFFKEQSIELHLTSSLPLQWVLCNLHEHSQHVLQRRRNTSLLLLNVPSRGYFVKDLILRATNDPEKTNICQERPHDGNTILQYNFRILRNCD
ncbi:Myelin regulatory factor [Lucilia cuprina]|nr:Myelin regulatory factor [Lucilia cuprina]